MRIMICYTLLMALCAVDIFTSYISRSFFMQFTMMSTVTFKEIFTEMIEVCFVHV